MVEKYIYGLLSFFCSIFIVFSSFSQQREIEDTDEEEFPEAIFFDTSTDIGGKKGVLEINVIPGFQKLKNGSISQIGFEFEYVLYKNFGIEIEPVYLIPNHKNVDDENGIGDLEIETQYTFFLRERMGLAGGIEFGIPLGNEAKGLGSGQFEVEPFVTFVYKTSYGLSVHPRFSLGFDIAEEPESTNEDRTLEWTWNVGTIYSINQYMFGAEFTLNSEWGTFVVSPQAGVEVGNLFIGCGVQLPFNSTDFGSDYNAIARLIYEIELGS